MRWAAAGEGGHCPGRALGPLWKTAGHGAIKAHPLSMASNRLVFLPTFTMRLRFIIMSFMVFRTFLITALFYVFT